MLSKNILKITILIIALSIPAFTIQSPIQPLQTILEAEGEYGWRLGTGMLGLGDINGDGWPDFAVSAGGLGRTFIYFGGPGILDGIPDVSIKGGGDLAMGDLNGSGYKDLVVRGPRDTLHVYFGKPSTPESPLKIDTVAAVIIPPEDVPDRFGVGSFAVGDLNNDGFDDLVVGARNAEQGRGKVLIYLGKEDFDGTVSFTDIGDGYYSSYGFQVNIADINGNGIADLAVSSIEGRIQIDALPRIDIFYGRDGWTFDKNSYDQRLDSRHIPYLKKRGYLFSLADINVDGNTDLIVFSDSGYVFYGRIDSLRWTPDFVFLNPDPTYFIGIGSLVQQIGDINGDGIEDYVISSRVSGATCALVYLGSPRPSGIPSAVRCKRGGIIHVTGLGDVNGDGINDFGFSILPDEWGYFVVLSGDTTLKVIEPPETLPDDFHLFQNYPNPFNARTTIEYALPEDSSVMIVIYDSIGREVIRLYEGNKEAGYHSVEWNGRTSGGTHASSGVYYYSLVIDGIPSIIRKAVLVK